MSGHGKVFLVDDDALIVATLSRGLKRAGFEVEATSSPQGVVDKISAWSPDVVLLDIGLPGRSGLEVLGELVDRGLDAQVVMVTGDDTAATAIEAMKGGAADYITKPFDLDEVRLVVRNLVEKQGLKREVMLRRGAEEADARREMVGTSPAMRRIRKNLEKIVCAGVDTLLITGESGTGKEVVARHIHDLAHTSDTRYAPFVAVNCTALPETLIESELFGHEKGAFTDAKANKKGVFELAAGGSLLLDEIGDMPLNLQGKLLRVLEERRLRRIGGKVDIAVETTVVASTNRNLKEAVDRGEFRRDLFFRLNAFALHLPPLRERGRDVVELGEHFLAHFARKYKKRAVPHMTVACEEALLAYAWPGNVRELRNVVERIVVLEGEEVIDFGGLPYELREGGDDRGETGHFLKLPEGGLSLEEVKMDLIVQALEQAKHNRRKAAELLSISYDTLRYQMKKYGLDS